MRWLAVIAVAACHPTAAAVDGAALGRVTPARIAAWVTSCDVPLKQRETALTLEVTCNERSEQAPSWRISIYYKDATVSSASFAALTEQSLESDVARRANALFGVAIGAQLARSVTSRDRMHGVSGISVARSSLPGIGRVPPLEEIRWTSSVEEK